MVDDTAPDVETGAGAGVLVVVAGVGAGPAVAAAVVVAVVVAGAGLGGAGPGLEPTTATSAQFQNSSVKRPALQQVFSAVAHEATAEGDQAAASQPASCMSRKYVK
mmetsp:Transcript_42163/g.111441  ORF Transcript_42163/g.111441 Transcript_42163/m.111441 type:complete len:106 (-) Transcript_42163:265-582(-)